MSMGDLFQNRILCPLTTHDGTVSLDDDLALTTPIHNVITRQPGVQFPLADRNGAPCSGAMLGFEVFDVRLEFIQVVDSVVRDAQGADLTGLLGGEESVPGS
jgi:hypothetical protein